jgi:hypothetical protein
VGLINVVVASRWLWMLDVLDNNNGSIICILSGNCLKEYVLPSMLHAGKSRDDAWRVPRGGGQRRSAGPVWIRRLLGGR